MWKFKKKKKDNTEKIDIEKLKLEIEGLRKKIRDMEYYEFKNKRRVAVLAFYTEAKKFCYQLLDEKKELLKKSKTK